MNKVTELIQTIKSNDEVLVEKLLTQGADPNGYMPEADTRIFTGATTPLMAASRQKNTAILKLLVRFGLTIQGAEPLRAAIAPNYLLQARISQDEVRMRTMETIKYLVYHGADLNAPDELFELTPFLMAIYENDLELVAFFIDQGAIINQISKKRNTKLVTPLLAAIETHSAPIVKLLLKHGGNANQIVEHKEPLQYSRDTLTLLKTNANKIQKLSTNNDKIIDLLVRNGAKTDYPWIDK